MSCSKATSIDLLTFKRSLYLEDLKDSIPKPKGAIPEFGLPQWGRMQLEAKIPMIPGLQDAYVLARRKLGEGLRIGSCDRRRFDVSDPWNRDVQLPYEGMHDAHLASFFREHEKVRDSLIKAGLVTQNLDVKCTLGEYNAYRNYLRIMHGKAVRKALEKRDEMLREKFMLNIAERQAEKTNERLKKEEIITNLKKEINAEKENRLRRLQRKLREKTDRVNTMYRIKNENLERRRYESRIKRQHFKQKRAVMAKKDQQKMLNTLKKWHERDYRLETTKEQNLLRKHNAKIAAALNKFEQKKKLQEEAIERDALLKDCDEKIKTAYIKEYNRKVNIERARLRELFLEKRKALNQAPAEKKKVKRKQYCFCKKSKPVATV